MPQGLKEWLYKEGDRHKFYPQDIGKALQDGWMREENIAPGAPPEPEPETLAEKVKKKVTHRRKKK